MDEWISQWSTPDEEPQKDSPKEPAAKSRPKPKGKKATSGAAAIGTNPNRRHTSSASRALKK